MSEDKSQIEREAERIIEEAFLKASQEGEGQETDEDCPLGDDCPVHFRVDEEVMDDKVEFGRIINYFGEYVVITTDNPEYETPAFILKLAFGLVKEEDMPPIYETAIIHVGDGALFDLRNLPKEKRGATLRFVQKHGDWGNFKAAHEAVLEGLKSGLIDASKPVDPKEL